MRSRPVLTPIAPFWADPSDRAAMLIPPHDSPDEPPGELYAEYVEVALAEAKAAGYEYLWLPAKVSSLGALLKLGFAPSGPVVSAPEAKVVVTRRVR